MPNENGIKILRTARFLKSVNRLPSKIQKKLIAREVRFRKSPFAPQLHTHKLHGRFQGYWAYSVDFHYRVIFIFEDEHTVTYYDIGPHHMYGDE